MELLVSSRPSNANDRADSESDIPPFWRADPVLLSVTKGITVSGGVVSEKVGLKASEGSNESNRGSDNGDDGRNEEEPGGTFAGELVRMSVVIIPDSTG